MSPKGRSMPLIFFPPEKTYGISSSPRGSVKRKSHHPVPAAPRSEHGYPSPPMSNPPSPSRITSELPANRSTTRPTASASSTTTDPAAPLAPPPLPPHSDFRLPVSGAESNASPSNGSSSLALDAQISQSRVPQTTSIAPVAPEVKSSPPSFDESFPRRTTSRKSKAHVTSACANCKRAHLSCDAQRPCLRCLASGKQDTCYDVPHKKRGRPRLRGDTEFKAERLSSEQSARPTVPAPASTSRPIAGHRHRRTESMRSLRSQTSEDLSPIYALPAPGFPQLPPVQEPLRAQNAPPLRGGMSPADVPTAFLDLDLNIIRANRPFQQITFGGQEVAGRRLADIVTPADIVDFEAIRNWLRAERGAREPNYLPPIVAPGHDPVQGVSESDVDRLSLGFADRTFIGRRSHIDPISETFPVRVRLTKANTYFVTITLPSFRPVTPQGPAPPPLAPSFEMNPPRPNPDQNTPGRQMDPQSSATPSPYYPIPSISAWADQPQVSHPHPPRTYPSPQSATVSYQPQYAYPLHQQQPPPPPPPPLLVPPHSSGTASSSSEAQASTDIARFTTNAPPPREDTYPPTPTTTTATHLTSPVSTPANAPPRTATAPANTALATEDDEDDSPRKRRRMSIHDVLQT